MFLCLMYTTLSLGEKYILNAITKLITSELWGYNLSLWGYNAYVFLFALFGSFSSPKYLERMDMDSN